MAELKIKQIIIIADAFPTKNEDTVIFPSKPILVPHLLKMQMSGDAKVGSAFTWHCMSSNLDDKMMPCFIEDEKIIVPVNTEGDLINQIESENIFQYDDVAPRAATISEKKLIYSFLASDAKKYTPDLLLSFEEFIKNMGFTVFDFNPSFQIVLTNEASIATCANGKKKVETTTFQFAIKHGLVYSYDEENLDEFGGVIDDFDEDISEITALL